MPSFLDIFGDRPMLADGAMGTVLYARGIFINRCYDELNLSDPGLILSIHEEYLQAGAEILETNTFGANRMRLAAFGLGEKLRAINLAGVNGLVMCAWYPTAKLRLMSDVIPKPLMAIA